MAFKVWAAVAEDPTVKNEIPTVAKWAEASLVDHPLLATDTAEPRRRQVAPDNDNTLEPRCFWPIVEMPETENMVAPRHLGDPGMIILSIYLSFCLVAQALLILLLLFPNP
ncbi:MULTISPECIES: hypothetical protein [unclassified Mesorhizobium]|uniref:hypothetical protein n=1 Tax=Mesorhizobium sp. L2C089B000 TaxID=1287120 RepID=UPI0003D000FB|nr:hypothetical protein [Mesorhizobium sp. L2C089B000]ESY99191.1 hypothetical protein X736_33345 [Mesorhizobium sp. L2C089B000]